MKLAHTIIALAAFVLFAGAASGQDYGNRLGVQRGGAVSFEPQGPGVLFGALDPAVKKWYVPQELYTDYGWSQREYSNYAQDPYERYVNTTREGDYFYDVYGNFTTRGWLIYDWRQFQPQPLGSGIFQSTRFNRWFNAVTISGDSQGQYKYAITVGDRIRTTLTPMTFSKPDFNGVQIDFSSDKYRATILASRVSEPIRGSSQTSGGITEPITQSNITSLFGGRATFQVGDFIELGATLMDASNGNTLLDMFNGDLIAGSLTAGQSTAPLTAVAIILSDDSPEDGIGGAALFSHDVHITSRDFETGKETVFTLQEVVRPGARWPIIFGGFRRSGFLAADGPERIIVNYDFNDPAYVGPNPTSIVSVDFDYVVANDFKIEMWSDRQTGQRAQPAAPLTAEVIDSSQPALITLRRAEGNVTDITNLQRMQFDYGLPTANLVGGFTLAGTGVLGFDFYGEWDRNKRYLQYPNAALFNEGEKHKVSSEVSDAWHFNVERQDFPWFVYGEAYSIEAAYATTAFLTNGVGEVQYDNSQRHLYEFVDDNDDQDRFPDWIRFGSTQDRAIYPGWDQNNDFITDFNQNDNATAANTIPDYDEPFLRYNVDRPEFLFGIDLNNNNWVDRFEDDDLPDFPYKSDRRGYNFFGGLHLSPEARLTLGRTDEESQMTDAFNQTNYALFTFDKDYAGLGRLRVFDMLKQAKDTIPDARREPTPFVGALIQPLVQDILPAQDTWVHTAFVGFDYKGVEGLSFVNKLKWEIFSQNKKDPRDSSGLPLNDSASFFGLINKVDYTYSLGSLDLQPRLKSEFLRQTAFIAGEDRREEWAMTLQLIGRLPVMKHTTIESGLEQLWFSDRVQDEDELKAAGRLQETGDLGSTNVAVQLSTTSDYLGYKLTTQVGLRFGRTLTERVIEDNDRPGVFKTGNKSRNETTTFITVFAGLE
ncbi:MAG: hypothetical protein HOL51_14220 [Gemmatimonadetes bacterium]|nr:hypothetical protein [Gemmatimonadota bacterium]MBT6907439.1 hypothetical protein [Gemmatimonadota bacterium]